MQFENLTSDSSLLYATKMYDNPSCMNMDEFFDDYRRFKYIRRLCERYHHTRTINIRLFLNHIIALINVFGAEATIRLLFVKNDESSYRLLKTVLQYMDIMPVVVSGINGFDIRVETIPVDVRIQKSLQEL
jgi:hypothetical protein